jgi:RimJ/RimL family protein N-acetyltransferase
MSITSDSIVVRRAALGDIKQLCDIYLGQPQQVRRWFHPFPFNRIKLKIIFLLMLISEKTIFITKKTIPKLGFILLAAEDTDNSQIVGFFYVRLIRKEAGGLVANVGFTTKVGAKNLGFKMYASGIKYSKAIGITKFRIRILADNSVTITLTKRLRFRLIGITRDEYWEGKYEEMLNWELDL